jgi:hemerythrin
MDDEHREIFESLSKFATAIGEHRSLFRTGRLLASLIMRMEDHFAHEERLMRAARYKSLRWHKRKHDAARTRLGGFVVRIAAGDTSAAQELIAYLVSWLHEHTRLADSMLAAFLRNHRRGLYKVTFRMGTKPMDACAWIDSRGEKFDPAA